jgi:hypothetical protein
LTELQRGAREVSLTAGRHDVSVVISSNVVDQYKSIAHAAAA